MFSGFSPLIWNDRLIDESKRDTALRNSRCANDITRDTRRNPQLLSKGRILDRIPNNGTATGKHRPAENQAGHKNHLQSESRNMPNTVHLPKLLEVQFIVVV